MCSNYAYRNLCFCCFHTAKWPIDQPGYGYLNEDKKKGKVSAPHHWEGEANTHWAFNIWTRLRKMALGQLGFATLLLCVAWQLPGAHFIDVIFILLSAVKDVDLWLALFSVKYPSKHGSEICSLRCQLLISCRSRESQCQTEQTGQKEANESPKLFFSLLVFSLLIATCSYGVNL